MERSIRLEDALQNFFGDSPLAAKKVNRCVKEPIGCGKPISETTPFRSELDAKEYRITGLCQDCQDRFEKEYDDSW